MSTIQEIDIEQFENLTQNDYAFIYITAVWCGPCKAFSPIVTEVSEIYGEKLKFGKLDADKNSTKLEELGVKALPTVILFKNGKEVERISGLKSKQNLITMIESHLQTTFSSDEDF